MKKVIASIFFLVFGLFLVGCKESISTSEYLKKIGILIFRKNQ